ncbi:unnamed protein product [Coregonus sp. 'balchen']|nr:unnamed protein product [Coregonus sp. 'balchen']
MMASQRQSKSLLRKPLSDRRPTWLTSELSTVGKPNAKLRQKPTAGRSSSSKGHGGAGGSGGGTSSSGGSTSSSTRASPASTVAARHGRPMDSNLSLDDITAQLEQASLSMDEAARQSRSLASASSSTTSCSTARRTASHHHTHRRTGSVGTVSEHEVRSISHSSRSSVNSASASSMDSLDRPLEQDGVTPTQQGPSQGPPGNTEVGCTHPESHPYTLIQVQVNLTAFLSSDTEDQLTTYGLKDHERNNPTLTILVV